MFVSKPENTDFDSDQSREGRQKNRRKRVSKSPNKSQKKWNFETKKKKVAWSFEFFQRFLSTKFGIHGFVFYFLFLVLFHVFWRKLSMFGVIRVNDEESNKLLFLVGYEPIRRHGFNVIRWILWKSTHTTTRLNSTFHFQSENKKGKKAKTFNEKTVVLYLIRTR